MNEENRPNFLTTLLLIVFLVLLGRLVFLQIIEGKQNRFLADTNRIAKIIIDAPRGLIFDRHGTILAGNDPVYLNQDQEIGRDEALTLQAEGKDADLRILFSRRYVYKDVFAHVLGYLGEVSPQALTKEKLNLKGYFGGSLLGIVGLEKEYETLLAGRKGSETVEVDTLNRIVRRVSFVPPVPGKSLTLAIDKNLQEIAEKQMLGKKGAVIASNPNNGEILLLFSSPSFDPNVFLDKKENQQVVRLISDEENMPLLNRAISGLYAPGSTFKIVTSIAGLEEGKITPDTLINDPGVIVVNDYKYANWYWTQYGRTEGEVNLVKAITRSTDTYFYKLGEMLGAENIIKWTKLFGLDKEFGIDLPSELPGFIGTPEWKKQTRNESWFLGNTYHLAIGQGDLDITPLGVNLMTAVVANGGKLCKPRMLRIGAENTPYQEDCTDLTIKKEYLEIIKKGMVGACESGGTGWPFFDFKPEGLPADRRVACKTGTAETGDGKTAHAWFTVMAPADNPEIVLTVLVERGGEGSTVAAPIAKEILKQYFRE